MHRPATQAGFFYPEDHQTCVQTVQKCLSSYQSQNLQTPIIAGIVPHAGWTFSGPTAGKVFQAIAEVNNPDTFVIFGAVHVQGVKQASIWKEGVWNSPLGDIEIDEELAEQILRASNGFITDSPNLHLNEHSIEVEIPFIQHLFPTARIVPIMVTAHPQAYRLGEILADLNGEQNIVAIASTDMTHYGQRFCFTPAGSGEKSLRWVKEENDRRMLDLICQLRDQEVVSEAKNNQNACGAGAIAATLAYSRKLGRSKGHLLEYTTSWDIHPERSIESFVGYSGVVI